MVRAAHWAWNERTRIMRYVTIGIGAVLLDNGLYAIFTRGFGIEQRLANMVDVAAVSILVFLGNKFWSFARRAETGQQSRRFIVLAICNYLMYQAVFVMFAHNLHFNDFLVKCTYVALQTSWNYLLYRYWIYGVE